MQFSFLPVGVKWKVVKNVHCPPLLIDTGLMSIGPLTKTLLQKHHPVSYSKKRRKLALSPRSLTESSAERRFVRASVYYIERKLWKRRLWNMKTLLAVTLFRFFWGQVDSELLPFIAERVTNIENTNLTPLCVPSVWRACTCTCPPLIR